MNKENSKVDPFLRKFLGSEYKHLPFENLSVSTATIDVRLVEDCNIDYVTLFSLLQIETSSSKERKRPAGTIFAGRCGSEIRGIPPTDSTVSLKNCMMIWMWLSDKSVNMKVSHGNVHITGCKTADHAAEAVRYLQMHIELLHSEQTPLYEQYPYCVDFDIHMINYNFSINVGIDLTKFDLFLNKNYCKIMYSPYNPNICATHMTVSCPKHNMKFTLNDNGQISMCTKGSTFEGASKNVCEGYSMFYFVLEEYRHTNI
jgi:nitrite reductase/ring-hydroxylating ferredoxin subunit